ncbi:PRC-barrel domain-containing protein [Candidatus Undinarchaeota archaeon]
MPRILARDLQGKTVVSEGGKMYGKVADVSADISTGELINIVVDPTKSLTQQSDNIIADERGRILLPFSAVGAIGDFVLINEKDII